MIACLFDQQITFGNRTFTPRTPGGTDVAFAEFDSAGDLVWAMQPEGRGLAAAHLCAGKEGHVYLAGWFRDGLVLGDHILNRPGRDDAFVADLYDSVIIRQPVSQGAFQGGDVMCEVQVLDPSGASFQWYEGVVLPGATNAVLMLSPLKESDAATYTVQVDNGTIKALSMPAVLTVLPPQLPPQLEVQLYAGVSVTGQLGAKYQIQRTDKITEPLHWNVVTNIVMESANFIWIDMGTASVRQHFYRAVVLP